MRWLNAHFEPEIFAQLFLGPIGTNLEKTESGMLDYIDTPEGMSYSEFRYANAPVHVPYKISADEWGAFVEWDTYLQQLQTLGIEKYKETIMEIRGRMEEQ